MCCTSILTGCDNTTQLQKVSNRGALRVGILTTPPIFFSHGKLLRGYDYDIVQAYAKSINAKLHVTMIDDSELMIRLLKTKQLDIGILGSTPIKPHQNIEYGMAYGEQQWYIIGYHNSLDDDQAITLTIPKNSHARWLADDHLQIRFNEVDEDIHTILNQINQRKKVYSLLSEHTYQHYRWLYPNIQVSYKLTKPYANRWLYLNQADRSLIASGNQFIYSWYRNSMLASMKDTYFQHLNQFHIIDARYYLKRIKEKLPLYLNLFQQTAKHSKFDWYILAALSYQESHWDEKAKSPTGVRGLMMLTQQTAKRFDINDRLDPKQSVMGGDAYLNILNNSLPLRIQEPERSWLTLAAYNVGLGHIEDVRIITQELGDNVDLWADVRKHLPKLKDENWYSKTKYGYARGDEPIRFVNQIRIYYDTLRLHPSISPKIKYLDLNININSPIL